MSEPEDLENEVEPPVELRGGTPVESLFERWVGAAWAAIGECLAFFGMYLAGRPWFLVPAAVPALLGLALALFAALAVWMIPDRQIVAWLEAERRAAVTGQDLATQRICLQAILAKKPDSQEHQLAFALLHREEGDTASATALLERLAPSDSVGYAPAHRQLAEDALSRYENAGPAADRQALLATALHHLKSSGPLDDPRLEYQLGVLCAEDGDVPLAELHLQQAAAQGYGVAHLVLSQLERQRGQLEAAEEHRRAARESLRSYVLEHPDDREARLGWGRCLLDGGEWAELGPLLAHLRRSRPSGRFRDRLGQLHLTAAQRHPLGTPAMVQAAVGYARDAFDLLDDPAPAAWQLIQFSRVAGTVPRELLVRIRQWQQDAARQRPADHRFGLIAAGLAEALGDPAAEADFQNAAKLDPRALSELASFYRRQKNTEKLAQTNAAIISHFESAAQEHTTDSTSLIVVAQAYAAQQRWPEARKIVGAAANKPAARAVMAGLFVEEFDALGAVSRQVTDLAVGRIANPSGSTRTDWQSVLRESPNPLPDGALKSSPQTPTKAAPADRPVVEQAASPADLAAWELLRLALLAVPDYPPALRRWEAAMIAEAKVGGRQLEGLVTRLLAEGEAPGTMHHLLGVRAFEQGDWKRAIHHWEQAKQLRPGDVVVLARLAAALLQSPESLVRMSEAESLVQQALNRAPGQPELLALRGQIRARQKNDVPAVADLEAALSRLPERRDLHRVLADCYERLGNKELSRLHRGLAEDGGRRSEDGGRRSEDGGRRSEDGGRRTESGER